MSHLQTLLWLCVAAYGLHVLEEFMLDWKTWSQQVLHLPTRWDDFYITNCLVIVIGIVAAMIAPEYPSVALGFPALMLINATLMHLTPFVVKRGRFSPGLITAVALFLPLGVATMQAARPTTAEVLTAFAVGAALLATPITFIVLRSKPYFDQTKPY
jgi:hypothetical protein